jgi:homoserine kinase type II
VAYEWALLDFLAEAGVPVPKRVPGTAPGEICVADKPTALFEVVEGGDICHRMFDAQKAREVGATLARIHRTGLAFPTRRASRFKRDTLPERLDLAASHERPELVEPLASLRAMCAEVDAAYPADLPRGVIHGDMFRDNVFWSGDSVSAVIDWESASDGELLYDLAVVFLAWCYADDFRWDEARALFAGYQAERPLSPAELGALRTVCMAGAARFAITRVLDFHLRDGGLGERVMKDYRRFLDRAHKVAALSNSELEARLTGASHS